MRNMRVKRVLIVGANSYIGHALQVYLEQYSDLYNVDAIPARGIQPAKELFSKYNCVFCAAGIAHIKEKKKNRNLYYKVNRDLVVSIAKASKEAGVEQFILLSSMSVYGLETGYISKYTEPKPVNAYGDSKYQADEAIKKLEDDKFKFVCLRPPMVYGKGCKGNYQSLRNFALHSPVFPDYPNQRSMVYIGNLCEFIKQCIDCEKQGIFFPQNAEYVNTSRMVELIANENHKNMRLIKVINPVLGFLTVSVVKKVFGTLIYEPLDMVGKHSFEESIRLTEE